MGICMRICLFPFMPHVRNAWRVRKPWPHIFYNTIGHLFPCCINLVPKFHFSGLINRVFPEPTLLQRSPVSHIIFTTSHVIFYVRFSILKSFFQSFISHWIKLPNLFFFLILSGYGLSLPWQKKEKLAFLTDCFMKWLVYDRYAIGWGMWFFGCQCKLQNHWPLS